MTIIQFNPNAWQNADEKQHIYNSQRQPYRPQASYDEFNYLHEEIEDEPDFLTKLQSLFGRKKTQASQSLTYSQEDAYNKSYFALKEALVNKKELMKMIFKGFQNDFKDMVNHAGNLVTFAQDEMSRGVMIEYDQKDKPVRITTFALNDGSIYKIEEKIPNSRSYNKTIFFNYNNSLIEVHKGIRGDKIKELYSFEKEKPTYYKKNCTMSPNGAIAKEEYYF